MRKLILLLGLVMLVCLLVSCTPAKTISQTGTNTPDSETQPVVSEEKDEIEPISDVSEKESQKTVENEPKDSLEDFDLDEKDLEQLNKELEDLDFNDLGGLSE
jgi:hypothetical protein